LGPASALWAHPLHNPPSGRSPSRNSSRWTSFMTSQSPVLLTTASYHGTLAAVRNLGHAGIPITLAYSSWLGPSCWSRYVTQRRRSPSPVEGQLFVEWLLDF